MADEDLAARFRSRVAQLLRERGISGREMGRRMDVDPSWTARMMGATHCPTLATIERAAEVLGVDPADLLAPLPPEPAS